MKRKEIIQFKVNCSKNFKIFLEEDVGSSHGVN